MNFKNILLITAFIISSLSIFANSNNNTTDDHNNSVSYKYLNDFNIVVVKGDVDLVYKPSIDSIGIVKIVEENSDLKKLSIKNIQGKLSINNKNKNNQKIVVYIYSPTLKSLSNHGSGDIDILGNLNTRMLDIYNFKSGKINCKSISCNELNLYCYGDGEVEIGGKAKSTTIINKGGCNIKSDNLNKVLLGKN